jgi:hypothetical protein
LSLAIRILNPELGADIVEEERTIEISGTTPDGPTTQPVSSAHGNFNLKVLMNSLNEAESSPNLSYTSYQHSDDECDLEDILPPMGTFTNDNSGTTTSNEVKQGPSNGPSEDIDWGKEWSDAEDDSEKKKSQILCPTHGLACSKKICLDYKKLDWERKREEAKKSGEWRGLSFICFQLSLSDRC